MPFFSDYGYYHGSAPFSSQYYSQILPYSGSNSSRPLSRIQPRNYNSIIVEQTLRAIRRGPGVTAARHYSRPVNINTSEIDVTSPRRPSHRPSGTETIINDKDEDNTGGSIHRGRTVVRLHTKNKKTTKSPTDEPKVMNMADLPEVPELPTFAAPVSEEGLAKKGTIKRHRSVGIKVPTNDDRRTSVTDEILREQEALFDTMIMEEMEGQKERRKSYPVDMDDNKILQRNRETRKKSAAAALTFVGDHPEKTTKKTNWKLNYDVIIEESGIEPVSFTFKLNKAKKESNNVAVDVGSVCSDNGKLDANHNVVVLGSHDDKINNNKKHEVKITNKNQTNKIDSDDVSMSVKKTKVVKKKIVVKKKVIKKKEAVAEKQEEEQKSNRSQGKQTPSPAGSSSSKKKKGSKTEAAVATAAGSSSSKKKKGSKTEAAVATAAVITPFVRASFGKTFISPSQVSKTKSKFEKPKPKQPETSTTTPPLTPSIPPRPLSKNASPASSSEDEDDDESNSDSSSSSSSTYFYSDDYGDKTIACSISSFDSGLPSSPVLATDPIDSSSSSSDTATNSHQIVGGGGNADGAERSVRSYSYRHHSRPKRVVPPATSIPRFRKYAVEDFNFLKVLGKGSFGKVLLAELKGTDYYYAVKCLKKDVVLEDDDVECTLIERKVLALGTNHPYLCHLFCTFQTESHLFFVMEYLNGGDLMFHIQQSGRFDEGRSRFYASEIVSGLKFLHKKGIVYRDLKLDNILLDFNGHVRIADFGMCKLQIYLDKTADTFCGTPDYMAPEIIKGQKYNQSVDWWSFGILLYEMLVGKSPFSGCDEDALFWSICNEQPQYPRYLSVDSKSVLVAFLEKDATKRLGSLEANHSAEDVIRHPFFSSMDWCKLERRELEPPYMPRVYHPLDTHYFDKHFTKEKPRLTPVDKTILQSMDQSQFDGFTYTNPNVTDS
ncbi:Protein kinase, ATP binding site,AGC-kinase, C-terminal,Protein kinase domain,Serine/threonine-protein [Cinara cedri]|uniref:Protein kinase, ATP binding site,AGC-kinase, C-terminal,Protein kinase domain,Serine/threonine-protein n=1 Tax=Cinara cedri TaxID=506608 RepID=A0A5E4MGG2_9HEMI|nr:Protein kinase, ATP binding site,AGC-kinase, C-terminal,Protein kinase domain,Serine/threonine-protein [Cinara cedri]